MRGHRRHDDGVIESSDMSDQRHQGVRAKRPTSTGGIETQERDLRLLHDLFVSRIMTLAHIAALHFEGRAEAAKKRLQKLKAAGLVRERPRAARQPAVLFLSKRGYALLHESGRLADLPSMSAAAFERRVRVSELTLRHELDVMTVKSALAPAIAATPGLSVTEFTTWPLLCEFPIRIREDGRLINLRVKPDGLLRVQERTNDGQAFEHAFFLEIDRGSEGLDTLALRARCYREHYASGGYAAALGAARGQFTDYPFRVLMVFPSEERRNNVAERLLQVKPAIETQTWLTTLDALAAQPLGRIWLRPRDYRDAMDGTPFDVRSREPRSKYRRQPERDALIQQRASLRTLFE